MKTAVKAPKKYSLLKNIFNKNFVISAIIPIVIYECVCQFSTEINGLTLSGLWCIAIVIISYLKTKKVDALAAIGAAFNSIGLIGTILSQNPVFYLGAPIIQDFLFAGILIISTLISKPIIQIVAEQSFLHGASDNIKNNPRYKSNWIIITNAWAVINIVQGIVRIIMLRSLDTTTYFTLNNIYSSIAIPLCIAGSIIFSHKYLTR